MNTQILDFNKNLDYILELDIFNKYQELIFITDNNLFKKYNSYLNLIESFFKEKNKKVLIYNIPNGELSKNIDTKIKIEHFLFSNNISRSKSCILALGGGVVGDISGFIASTYKRGIDFIQIPTTVMSMVDSSIGGKNGINNEFGKNLIGTFYQPKYILIFYSFLLTLPRIELINGMAEIIKIAALSSKPYLWNLLDNNNLNTIIKNPKILHQMILEAANLKVEICNQDLYDNSINNNIKLDIPREHLNFGHTIGHIIEYSENIPHGYAVSLGMIYELKLLINQNITHILKQCLEKYELPTLLKTKIREENIKLYFYNDKKDGRIVLLRNLGNSYTKKFEIKDIINIIG
jgi:3-dehydroquinate synthetase